MTAVVLRAAVLLAALASTPALLAGPTDGEIALPTFEYEYATGHCAYNGSQYGKNDFGLVKIEREIVLHPPSATERVGWFKFDLSALPDTVTITGARVHHIITYFEHSMGLAWTCLNLDPVTTGAQALYNAIHNSEVCAMGPMGRVFDTTDLGPIGVNHIRNSLARGWVAFGLVGYDYSSILTKRGWIIGWNNQPRSDSPWLIVTHEPPTAVAEPEPVPVPVGFTIGPNPLAGGLATLRYSLPGPGSASVRVYDATGREVFRQATTGSGQAAMPLDLRGLGRGVYLARLEAAGFQATQKLVVLE